MTTTERKPASDHFGQYYLFSWQSDDEQDTVLLGCDTRIPDTQDAWAEHWPECSECLALVRENP